MWHLAELAPSPALGRGWGAGPTQAVRPCSAQLWEADSLSIRQTDRQTDGEAVSKQPEGNH